MISSTARDLPEHRKAVEDACRRMGMDPEELDDDTPSFANPTA
jgi:hypothetical protein